MRIAVLADIHGNLAALEAVVADFTRRGVDAVVNLGDHLAGPLLPRETARFLMARPWTHLAGNHERQMLTAEGPRGPSDEYALSRLGRAELDWLAALPPTAMFEHDVRLCHGTPGSDTDYFLETAEPGRVRPATPREVEARRGGETAALILCGHTHTPRSVRTARGSSW